MFIIIYNSHSGRLQRYLIVVEDQIWKKYTQE